MVTEGVVSTFLNLLCLRQLTFADHTIATQWVNSPDDDNHALHLISNL